MKSILYPLLIFIALGSLFFQCDDDTQTKMNGTLTEHSACKNFLAQNSPKFDVADTTTSIVFTYSCTPFDNERINAIPIIPILPANAVKIVLPFFVHIFVNDYFNAVKKFIDVFFNLYLDS